MRLISFENFGFLFCFSRVSAIFLGGLFFALRQAKPGIPALTPAPSEPIASVSDGHPARALSEPITSVSDGRPLSTAGTSHRGADPAPAADPHRGNRVGGRSASHLSGMPLPAADNTTMPTASAAATLAASPSPDVIEGPRRGPKKRRRARSSGNKHVARNLRTSWRRSTARAAPALRHPSPRVTTHTVTHSWRTGGDGGAEGRWGGTYYWWLR